MKILSAADLDFVVVGGFAGVLHGSTLVTRDLDLCTVLAPENLEKLRSVLKDFNPKHRMIPLKPSFLSAPPTGQRLDNLYLETDLGVVDFLTSITGVGDFEIVKSRSETIKFEGYNIKFMDLDSLIDAKTAMKREKDLMAVRELKAIRAKRK